MRYIALGLKRDNALSIVGLTSHQYYYKPKLGRPRGRPPSTHTIVLADGAETLVPNSSVVKSIKNNHADPDLKYGYQRMTKQLMMEGFNINHKKTYRLMKENLLLLPKNRTSKKYAKYRLLTPKMPLEMLEMDIKFVWVESERKHAYILTILDVFTRATLDWHVGFSIKQHTVKAIWERVIENHLQPNDMLNKDISIEIRNDNDPRFSAKTVQDFFKKNYLNQVFTHPYTPQENGHIESFHAILGRSLDRVNFLSIHEVERHLCLFYLKYNETRLHGSLAGLPPKTFWKLWDLGHIDRTEKSNRKVVFKLNIPYHQVSGKMDLKEASCLDYSPFDRAENPLKENGAITLNQLSVQKEPSVASC